MKIFGATISELYDKGVIREGSAFGELIRTARLEARREVTSEISLRLLRKRFGEIDSKAIERINSLSLECARELSLDLLDFKEPTDLAVWLDNEQVH